MFIPEEIWLIIFKYLDYYDINNLVIFSKKFPQIAENMQNIKRVHYTRFFKKYIVVRNLIYTYQNINTINSSKEYMRVFNKNYNIINKNTRISKILSLYLREYISKIIIDLKRKKKFNNLTFHIGNKIKHIRDMEIQQFEYHTEINFFMNNCITK